MTTRSWLQVIFSFMNFPYFHALPIPNSCNNVAWLAYNDGIPCVLHSIFQIKFDGKNLSQTPTDHGVLENQLLGGNSLGIIIYECENPLGTIKQVLFENQLASEQDLQITKVKPKCHLNSIDPYVTNFQVLFLHQENPNINLPLIKFQVSISQFTLSYKYHMI